MKYPAISLPCEDSEENNDEIAARLGCSKKMLYYYLRGDILPPVEKIKLNPQTENAYARFSKP